LTSLKSGSSRLGQSSVILKPNQKALFYKTEGNIAVNETNIAEKPIEREAIAPQKLIPVKVLNVTDTKIYTSWKDARWIFKNEKLVDLVPKIERRYDVNITFRDTVLKSYAFTGTLMEESLEQVLKALQLSAPIGFEIKEKNLILFEDRTIESRYLSTFKKRK